MNSELSLFSEVDELLSVPNSSDSEDFRDVSSPFSMSPSHDSMASMEQPTISSSPILICNQDDIVERAVKYRRLGFGDSGEIRFSIVSQTVDIPFEFASNMKMNLSNTNSPSSDADVENGSKMPLFEDSSITNFKYVLYNLLANQHNNTTKQPLIEQITTSDKKKKLRKGFRLNAKAEPEKRLAELYSKYVRKADLNTLSAETDIQSSVFVQDLYKFYHRSCEQLLSKYFDKVDKYTWVHSSDRHMFEGGLSLHESEERLKAIPKKKTNKRSRDDDLWITVKTKKKIYK